MDTLSSLLHKHMQDKNDITDVYCIDRLRKASQNIDIKAYASYDDYAKDLLLIIATEMQRTVHREPTRRELSFMIRKMFTAASLPQSINIDSILRLI